MAFLLLASTMMIMIATTAAAPHKPVRKPTGKPTAKPTPAPKKKPVTKPVRAPVAHPVRAPVVPPVRAPVAPPVRPPVASPTVCTSACGYTCYCGNNCAVQIQCFELFVACTNNCVTEDENCVLNDGGVPTASLTCAQNYLICHGICCAAYPVYPSCTNG